MRALFAYPEPVQRHDAGVGDQLHTDLFPVYLPQKAPSQQADIVLANILAGPLVELAATITNHLLPGGQLCLSGVLTIQAEQVQAAYRPWIDFDPVATNQEWCRLTGRKKT